MSPVEAASAIASGVFIGSTVARWLLLAEMLLHRKWHRWQHRDELEEQARIAEHQRVVQERIRTASARATAASVTRLDEHDEIRIAFGKIIDALADEDEQEARELASDAVRSQSSPIKAVDMDGLPMKGVPEVVALEIAIDGMLAGARYVVTERQRER